MKPKPHTPGCHLGGIARAQPDRRGTSPILVFAIDQTIASDWLQPQPIK
jgi:hypothetical protein